MTTIIKAAGQGIVKNIVNSCSANGYVTQSVPGSAIAHKAIGTIVISSGALVANTLKSVLSIAGGGVIDFLAITNNDGTARTQRSQLIIDGVVVFDSKSAVSATAPNYGAVIVGAIGNTSAPLVLSLGQIAFNSSLDFKVESSLTETDMFNIY